MSACLGPVTVLQLRVAEMLELRDLRESVIWQQAVGRSAKIRYHGRQTAALQDALADRISGDYVCLY
ncbi:hypothetical protein GNP09_10965 [Escherichia coli]|nr:hypothetical protein [Escherichia coli]